MTNREGTPSSLSKRSSSTMEQKLYLTLYKLSKLSCSKLFLSPVPTSVYPDYTQLIKNPMDISTIIEKLKQSKYRYISEVHNDLMLICKNSFSYHRGRQSQKSMKQAVAKFIKSIDHAWNLLRKNIEELNKRQEAELIRGEELTKLITNIELMIKRSFQKKIEKLTLFKVVIKEETNGIAAVVENQTNKRDSKNMQSQSQDQQTKKKGGMPLQRLSQYQDNIQFVSGKTGQNNNQNKVIHKSKTQSYHRQQSQQISQTDQLSYGPRQENNIAADKKKEELYQENRKQGIGENEESVTLSLNKKYDSNKRDQQKQQERVGKDQLDIDGGQICQDFNKLVKHKLKKYKALLLHYINWIQNNIFEVQPINKCDEHIQHQHKSKSNEIIINKQQEQASQLLCYDCIQYEKQRDMHNELKDMLTFRYLQMFLAREKKEVEKGQINLKRLLKFLKELNLWLKLLSNPYINWRSKQEFIEIERNLIKCFEKIIQYKKLGPQFSNQIKKIKNENKEGQYQNDSMVIGKEGVRTRSKKRVKNQGHDQTDFIRKYQLDKRKQIKQLNLTNKYHIVDTLLDIKEGQNEVVKSKDQQYQQFLSLVEQDQIYNSFKVVIVRDKEDPHTLIVKNKKQQIKRRRINRKKRQNKMKRSLKDRAQSNKLEDSILEQTDQDEYQPPIKQRLIKHRNQRRCSNRQKIDEQDLLKQLKQRQQQQRKEDEQLIYHYSLKSNCLVIEKYQERLQLDWNKKWQEIFGAVPDKIEFHNVTAEQSQIIQS